ncbi:uncharacterized protein LOC103713134 [Phoenix dactylifera]|uniref:Uncharacterized protein LOC103713134 n=1 Tax=Phoenix dactylifera TaxID=42345 RepID=A0A8B7CFP8_PHODC|nr:uncharacterized protein LOC103713134 [Phoenix dactylifera]
MLSKNKRIRKTHSGNPPKSAAMADSSERKCSLKLSLFVGRAESFASEPTTARSPRCFDDGAVGLGIVAAMSKAVGDARAPALSRTEPIPILPARPPTPAKQREPTARDEELSESYTCVTSHVRGNPVTERVYFGDGFRGVDGNYRRSSEVFFESPLRPPPPTGDRVLEPLLSVPEGASWARCFHVQRRESLLQCGMSMPANSKR